MFGVILAGGSGSRLWPLSRELYPKQLLTLNADKSLLQATFERLNNFIPAQNIISVTNSKHHSNIKMQLSKLSEDTVILAEPISKNTAPAIALSIKYIVENYNEDDFKSFCEEYIRTLCEYVSEFGGIRGKENSDLIDELLDKYPYKRK